MLFANIQTQQYKACYRRVDLELRDNRLITSTIILLCFPFTFYFVSFHFLSFIRLTCFTFSHSSPFPYVIGKLFTLFQFF